MLCTIRPKRTDGDGGGNGGGGLQEEHPLCVRRGRSWHAHMEVLGIGTEFRFSTTNVNVSINAESLLPTTPSLHPHNPRSYALACSCAPAPPLSLSLSLPLMRMSPHHALRGRERAPPHWQGFAAATQRRLLRRGWKGPKDSSLRMPQWSRASKAQLPPTRAASLPSACNTPPASTVGWGRRRANPSRSWVLTKPRGRRPLASRCWALGTRATPH